jgi:hypothetical protein
VEDSADEGDLKINKKGAVFLGMRIIVVLSWVRNSLIVCVSSCQCWMNVCHCLSNFLSK